MEIKPFLWFENQAEEAVQFYVSVIKNSKINDISRYGDAGPMASGTAMVIEFLLCGQNFMAINGGSVSDALPTDIPPKGAIALFLSCASQEELDHVWDNLLIGGEELQCGWLKDKYGFSWNIVPEGLSDYVAGDNQEGARRAMEAMLAMKKLDLNILKKAYERTV